jgi:hypothetical protein
LIFRPLHDGVYNFLNTLDEDGTRDQSLVVEKFLNKLKVNMISGTKNKQLQSMDLSAATDRLPVKLQAQILNILGYDGNTWKELLDRTWYFEGIDIKYTVGQPMGAYSSFAMLALTHHVIVKIAARRAGFINFKHYMVLGDDGAMANKRVAKKYVELFSYLGMEINPIKGFTGSVLEFAKQLYSINGYNISPLGAKNVMLAIRFIEFLPMVLYEL